MAMNDPILTVKNLNVGYFSARRELHAVRNVSFTLGREKVAIIGESGSGKSTVGRAIVRLLPEIAKISADEMQFEGQDMLALSEKRMQAIRGARISMILQDPKFSLNPVMSVGEQVAEAYLAHHRVGRAEAKKRAIAQLAAVKIRDPEHVYTLYPHEVSGGMGQRIMIAMMLIPDPAMIIADEPTSALDVTVRLQVLALLDDLVKERGIGLLFISHDLNLVQSFCDRVLIMYSGQVVEELAAADLGNARHPYTQGLLASLPRIGEHKGRLPVLDRQASWAEALGRQP
ncbi:oligopeptide transport ATP-binding protein OppD [Pelagibacterium halotolerans B2]|uniref:Oligopeptide transport ATP-binding protein OppD n=2 Tax=Pelagibacterium TaxID=1082930 RepID=G4RFM3_PELHB|nr:oligopeptide transport ATP-binding protein OppD [Pelagibacterium halotolerans B2]QJR17318.1 ABC transporter ATP-binding protein [Pelagibacterium halotolerans]